MTKQWLMRHCRFGVQYPESFGVGHWFTDFAAVYGHALPGEDRTPDLPVGKRPRKRGSKKVLQVGLKKNHPQQHTPKPTTSALCVHVLASSKGGRGRAFACLRGSACDRACTCVCLLLFLKA